MNQFKEDRRMWMWMDGSREVSSLCGGCCIEHGVEAIRDLRGSRKLDGA
jgi:hypothetical protein